MALKKKIISNKMDKDKLAEDEESHSNLIKLIPNIMVPAPLK